MKKTETGLKALAGKVPLLPAKAASPALFIIHHATLVLELIDDWTTGITPPPVKSLSRD